MTNERKIVKEETKLQFHWYLLSFFLIYFGSFIISTIILFVYLIYFFIPNVLKVSISSELVFQLNFLLTLLLWPFVLIICYVVHLFFVGFFTRIIWKITEKISPINDGIIPRNIRSKTVDIYHIRSFIMKYGKNAFSKGPFPWLLNWFYNFVGANNIGKGTTMEDHLGGDKGITIGSNSYVGVNSILTSNIVEGIFGNISYFKVIIGDDVTAGGWNAIGPGSKIRNNSYLLPSAIGAKHYSTKGNGNYYFGQPLKKLFKKKFLKYLQLTAEDLKKEKGLRRRQLNETNSSKRKRS